MDRFKGNENTDANDQTCQHFSTWKLRTISFSYSVLDGESFDIDASTNISADT